MYCIYSMSNVSTPTKTLITCTHTHSIVVNSSTQWIPRWLKTQWAVVLHLLNYVLLPELPFCTFAYTPGMLSTWNIPELESFSKLWTYTGTQTQLQITLHTHTHPAPSPPSTTSTQLIHPAPLQSAPKETKWNAKYTLEAGHWSAG